MDAPNKWRFRFGLKEIFVATTICAFLALVWPFALDWLYPPRFPSGGESLANDPEFREFMRQVEQSIHQPPENETGVTIVYGAGQEVMPNP